MPPEPTSGVLADRYVARVTKQMNAHEWHLPPCRKRLVWLQNSTSQSTMRCIRNLTAKTKRNVSHTSTFMPSLSKHRRQTTHLPVGRDFVRWCQGYRGKRIAPFLFQLFVCLGVSLFTVRPHLTNDFFVRGTKQAMGSAEAIAGFRRKCLHEEVVSSITGFISLTFSPVWWTKSTLDTFRHVSDIESPSRTDNR